MRLAAGEADRPGLVPGPGAGTPVADIIRESGPPDLAFPATRHDRRARPAWRCPSSRGETESQPGTPSIAVPNTPIKTSANDPETIRVRLDAPEGAGHTAASDAEEGFSGFERTR